jgi:hypothetical protein
MVSGNTDPYCSQISPCTPSFAFDILRITRSSAEAGLPLIEMGNPKDARNIL